MRPPHLIFATLVSTPAAPMDLTLTSQAARPAFTALLASLSATRPLPVSLMISILAATSALPIPLLLLKVRAEHRADIECPTLRPALDAHGQACPIAIWHVCADKLYLLAPHPHRVLDPGGSQWREHQCLDDWTQQPLRLVQAPHVYCQPL